MTPGAFLWATWGGCALSTTQISEPGLAPPVLLGGQASLSVDHWRDTATLRVQTFRVASSPLPEDRQGISMGHCEKVVPQTSGSGMVFEAEAVHVLCPGHTLSLVDSHSGSSTWVFERRPEPGLVCTLAIGEDSAKLPPLPSVPALEITGRQASWEPVGADEVRLVNLGTTASTSGVCRFADLGEAKLPPWMDRGETTLATWHSARLTEINKRPMSLSATAGTWLNAEAP